MNPLTTPASSPDAPARRRTRRVRPAAAPSRARGSGERRDRGGRGFSIIEMLVALAISAALLTATLAALDASFKSYKVTTEAAGTNVVSRMVVHRILTLIRTGEEFGPYPEDVLDQAQNPVSSSFIEFVSAEDRAAGLDRITRIERREADGGDALYELWYVLLDSEGNVEQEHPLLEGVQEAVFTLEYEVGPRLVAATVDLTVAPNDYRAIETGGALPPPVIRLIATTSPRNNEAED